MHIVFLNQYYPPDVAPTGVMLGDLVKEMAEQGHEVTVLCAEGGYGGGGRVGDEEEDGVSREQPSAINIQHSTSNIQHYIPSILRIGATRFGRGSMAGKLLDYFSYYLGVAWKLGTMRPGPERIIALTTPPYLSVLARVMSKLRGGDHAHWVMDLYPDVMVAHGMLGECGLPYRILSALARWGWGGGRCAAVVTLGPDMADRLRRSFKFQDSSFQQEESCAPGSFSHSKSNNLSFGALAKRDQHSTFNIHWVPLWGGMRDVGGEGHTLRRKRGWADDELVVMYSGNMGLGHRFGEILEVAVGLGRRDGPLFANGVSGEDDVKSSAEDSSHARPTPMGNSGTPCLDRLRFIFYGGGKRREEVERFIAGHPDLPVELHDYVAADGLAEHLASADVHLVSLDAAWTGTMVPSKLQGVFAVGRPVIFIGSSESSLGRWVAESGGGWVVAPGDVDGLLVALEEACDLARRAACGQAARAFAATHFDKATNVSRVVEALLG